MELSPTALAGLNRAVTSLWYLCSELSLSNPALQRECAPCAPAAGDTALRTDVCMLPDVCMLLAGPARTAARCKADAGMLTLAPFEA